MPKTSESDKVDFTKHPELWKGVRSAAAKEVAARIYRYLDYGWECFHDDPGDEYQNQIEDAFATLISMSDPEEDRLKRATERVERLEEELEWAREDLGE